MKTLWLCVTILLFIGCSKESPKERMPKFNPPEDGRISVEKAKIYITASKHLMDAISKHEKDIQRFTVRYNISEDLSEISDSVYCRDHPEVIRAWERLQTRWRNYELKAYQKAGINEEEFNWIGGALADTVNAEIQEWIQEQLQQLYR